MAKREVDHVSLGAEVSLRTVVILAVVSAVILAVGVGLYSTLSSPQGNSSTYSTPAGILKAVTGVVPTVVPLGDSWQGYCNTRMGLTLRYPPSWKYVEEPQQSGVQFYPPESDPTHPSPLVGFYFAPDYTYNPKSAARYNTTRQTLRPPNSSSSPLAIAPERQQRGR